MESFLNGRTEQPKAVVKVKKKSGLESSNLRVPEPGSALDKAGNSQQLETISEGENVPTVQLVMEDEEVKKILIQCTCGQKIELVCESLGARRVKA
ncbi:MAG: hypothetical protein AAF212_04130 [Verrucomicrobiota bacterium]